MSRSPRLLLAPHHSGLSQRAVEILRLLAQRLSDREIAEQLVMTVSTVKWYNRQIYSSLNVSGRRQAIVRARELHLLDSDDLAGPMPALQLVPLRTHSPIDTLPLATTRFIGRTEALAALQQLVATTRLVTLVGPPGSGKTRLALHLARQVAETFCDGAYWVSLGPISDPAEVPHVIASVLGISDVAGQPPLTTLKDALREKRLLLVLDNYEHLLPAGAHVAEMLADRKSTRLNS